MENPTPEEVIRKAGNIPKHIQFNSLSVVKYFTAYNACLYYAAPYISENQELRKEVERLRGLDKSPIPFSGFTIDVFEDESLKDGKAKLMLSPSDCKRYIDKNY